MAPFDSYRASFDVPHGEWATVRVPWSGFKGHGVYPSNNPLDPSKLTRVGVVAIGRAMDVTLAVSGVRFYKN